MKKALAIGFPVIIGIGALIFIYSKIDFSQVLSTFSSVRWYTLLIYLAAIISIELLLVKRWDIVLKAQNIFIPYHKLFMYKECGYAAGYLSPQAHIGGEPVRALLLKRHNISFKKAISGILVDKSLTATTDAFFASIGVILIFTMMDISSKIKIMIMLFGLIPISLLIVFYYRMLKGRSCFASLFRILHLHRLKFLSKHEKNIEEVEGHMKQFFKSKRQVFFKVFGINIVLWGLMFLEYWSALYMLGHVAGIIDIFVILSSVALSYMVPVPMALGALELGQIGANSLLDMPKAIGVSISLLIRLKDILRTTLGLSFLSVFGVSWRMKKGKNKVRKH